MCRKRIRCAILWSVSLLGLGGVGCGQRDESIRIEVSSPARGTHTTASNVTIEGSIYSVAGNIQADSFLCNSSRELKKDIASLTEKDYSKVLETINQLEVVRYRYKGNQENKLHIGLIAEDSPKDILSQDGKSVSLYDSMGYMLAGMKALIQENQQMKAEIAALKKVD